MKDGWWINYKTGNQFPIHEHELWIRDPVNAKVLGIPPALTRQFSRYLTGRDRNAFLTWLMKKAPIMRVRGHGLSVTFEYHATDNRLPLKSIRLFASEECSPESILHIVNFVGMKMADVRPDQLGTVQTAWKRRKLYATT